MSLPASFTWRHDYISATGLMMRLFLPRPLLTVGQ
jgi:hypothetical protein